MGGLDALTLCAGARSIANVRGAMLYSPVTDLALAYAGEGDVAFTGYINTAYGITGTTPNTYAERTAGCDPMARAAADYTGLRFHLTASPSDTTVSKALNTDAFATLVAGTAAEATVTVSSGGHTDASQCADVAGAVAFVSRCTG